MGKRVCSVYHLELECLGKVPSTNAGPKVRVSKSLHCEPFIVRERSPQYGLNDTIQTFITQAHEVLPYNSVYVINRQSGPGQSKQKLTSMLGLAVVLENQDLVEMLLNSAAEVHPDIGTVPPLMRAVLSEHKGNVQLSWVGHRRMVWKGYRPRVRLVLAGGHASAWLSPFWRGPAPGAQREPKGSPKVPSGRYTGAFQIDTIPQPKTSGWRIALYSHTSALQPTWGRIT